jgi:transcriptional regulator with XRE-family HTH domain
MTRRTKPDDAPLFATLPAPASPELPPMETLSDRVAYLLEQREMTKLRLEEEAKLARGYVTRIIKGERLKLSPELLRRMADVLQVGYEWLATGRGDMYDVSPPPSPPKPPRTAALDAAIAYHKAKWHPAVVAAARVLAAAPEAEELDPPEWADVLDQLEAAISKVKLRKRP